MKKLFLLFATAGLLLASCSNDDNGYDNGNGNQNGESRLLPSKIIYTWLDEFGTPHNSYTAFVYDDLNRLIKYIQWGHWGSDTLRLYYETGNNPVRVVGRFVDGDYSSSREIGISLVGNLLIFNREEGDWTSTDTIVVNSSMQIVNWEGRTFEYDANGNISQILGSDTATFTYTNIQSVFRYANVPCWLMNWVFDLGFYPAQGYMPASWSRGSGDDVRGSTFTYTVDGNWVRTRTTVGGDENVATFEYINAR